MGGGGIFRGLKPYVISLCHFLTYEVKDGFIIHSPYAVLSLTGARKDWTT